MSEELDAKGLEIGTRVWVSGTVVGSGRNLTGNAWHSVVEFDDGGAKRWFADDYITRSTPTGEGVEAARHAMNEYADGLANDIQRVRNIRDGISTPDDALPLMEEWLERCNALARAALGTPLATPSHAPAVGDLEVVAVRLARQTITDLKAAHEEICKLQDIDPAMHSWPEWSSPAHTIAWCEQIIAGVPAERLTALQEEVERLTDLTTVKPLEWWQDTFGDWHGELAGWPTYLIRKQQDGWHLALDDSTYASLSEAQTAAQADYEQRVRSALVVPAERLTALQEEVERLTDLTTAMGLATREQAELCGEEAARANAAEAEVERLREALRTTGDKT